LALSLARGSCAACLVALMVVPEAALGSAKPFQYLDDVTGATVTVVGRPLVFVRERFSYVRDYVTLAAASVDQSGRVSYAFIGYFWSAGAAPPTEDSTLAREPIVLQLHDRRIVLTPDSRPARESGIGAAIHQPPFGHPVPCVYPVDLDTLRTVAESTDVALYGGGDAAPRKYELFENGLDALGKLVHLLTDSN
jgi:hypothetical protein